MKSARPTAMASVARTARTDADRGESVSSASSPSVSPRRYSRITRSAPSSTASSRPARTMYISSAGSRLRNSHFPAARRRVADVAASRLTSSGSTPENSGILPRNCAADSSPRLAGPSAASAITRRGRGGRETRCGSVKTGSNRTASDEMAGQAASPDARASPGVGADAGASPGVTRPTSRQPIPVTNRQAAPNVQASRNSANALACVGVPMIATTTATPIAAPTARATEFIPVAVAKPRPGAEATAVPVRFGNVMPAPIPSSTMPGSHAPAKSGVVPTRATNHSTAPPQSRPPATRTGRGPMCCTSRLAGPATTTAMTGPTLSARPA